MFHKATINGRQLFGMHCTEGDDGVTTFEWTWQQIFARISQLLQVGNIMTADTLVEFGQVIVSAVTVNDTLDLVDAELYVVNDRAVPME